MTRTAYPAYKPSGIEWLGEIPQSWRVAEVKHTHRVTLGKMLQSEAKESNDVLLPYLRAAHIPPTGFTLDDPKKMWFSKAEAAELTLKKGDVVVVEGGMGGYGRCDIVPEDVPGWGFQNSINRLRPIDENCGAYTKYLLQMAREKGFIDVLCSVSTMPHLTAEKLSAIRLPLPCADEQWAIAAFLDRETAKIDVLIAKQEQLIATLREERSVTVDLVLDQHGFTPPRSLTDLLSVNLPTGWQVVHLGTLLRQLTNGFVGPTRDILVDEGVPYIQSTHLKQGRIDFNRRPFYVRQEWHAERPRIHLREGDVLIVQTGDIGKVAVVPANFGEASCHALQIARVKPEILTGEYLGTFLSSWIGYNYLRSLATGALHPHLEAGIRATPVVVPPLDVQSVIVHQVHEQIAKTDALVNKADQVIGTLREYRSALITDAVTGQIDARGAA